MPLLLFDFASLACFSWGVNLNHRKRCVSPIKRTAPVAATHQRQQHHPIHHPPHRQPSPKKNNPPPAFSLSLFSFVSLCSFLSTRLNLKSPQPTPTTPTVQPMPHTHTHTHTQYPYPDPGPDPLTQSKTARTCITVFPHPYSNSSCPASSALQKLKRLGCHLF